MKKLLLAVLAVAALAVVAVVIFENMPERRMDRKLDRLLRLYEDEPKKLYQRLADDRDLVGLLVFSALWCFCGQEDCFTKWILSGWDESMSRLTLEICDCTRTGGFRAILPEVIWATDSRYHAMLRGVWVTDSHSERCKYRQAWERVGKRWGPYMDGKREEIREKAELRLEFHTEATFDPLRYLSASFRRRVLDKH